MSEGSPDESQRRDAYIPNRRRNAMWKRARDRILSVGETASSERTKRVARAFGLAAMVGVSCAACEDPAVMRDMVLPIVKAVAPALIDGAARAAREAIDHAGRCAQMDASVQADASISSESDQ